MSTDYVVAVPSYQRAEKLQRKTLRILAERHVPMDRVHVFVHNNDPQLLEYMEVAEAAGAELAVTRARGIREQRRAVRHHFREDTNIVSMDDDIDRVMLPVSNRWSGERQLEDLDDLFQDMFARTRAEGLYVWGVSPVYNPFFLKPGEYAAGLNLVMFTMYGFINRHESPVHDQSAYYKDEQELSLRAWWYDGGTLRNKGVAVQAEYYSPGGCQAEGRQVADVEASVQTLLEEWPGLITRAEKRSESSGWPEVKLARRARKDPRPADAPLPFQEEWYVAAHQRRMKKQTEELI